MSTDIDAHRIAFAHLLEDRQFVTDKTGVRTIELIGASIVIEPTEDSIFGEPNPDYIARELEWYEGQSLNVNDIPGGPPAIWKQVADKDGLINSNYGHLIYSNENWQQYKNVLEELKKNPFSRRAVMIYTRPSIWFYYNYNGRSDFICTNTVQYVIRENRLSCIVQMRSGDVVFGFRNDLAWQRYVLEKLANELGVEVGNITWQVGSLHVYERHFFLVDNFIRSGYTETTIKKKDYIQRYPDSEWI